MDPTSTTTRYPVNLLPNYGHVDPPPLPLPLPPPPPPLPQRQVRRVKTSGTDGGPQYAALVQRIRILSLVGYLPDGRTVYLFSAPTTIVKTEPAELTIGNAQIKTTGVKAEPTPAKTPARKPARKPVRRRARPQRDGPYVKKPPNAFMLFMREQRPSYAELMTSAGSAAVNGLLGQKWSSLSRHEQAGFYAMAAVEKRHHALLHPDWNPANNYGVKRKRDRSRASTQHTAAAAAASTSGGVAQQDRTPREAPRAASGAGGGGGGGDDAFWSDFNQLAEVKELKLGVDEPAPPPPPPESSEQCDDDEELLAWAAEVKALLAPLELPEPDAWLYSDECRFSLCCHS